MKIVLAYSGGLDTSVALKWLQQEYRADVIAYCADIGQSDNLADVEAKALATGASSVIIEDLRREFITDYAFKALRAGAAYESQYLLAAPLGRPLITKHLVDVAHKECADAIAHGATGKGNDQVRFYVSATALDPALRVIAPVIDWEMRSRTEELEYALRHNISVPITKESPYSIDTNIWGSSIECGILDDISLPPPKEVYQLTVSPQEAPDAPTVVRLGFNEGIPNSLDGAPIDPLELVGTLNGIGGAHGVGRIDIIENRLVGIKTRGVYESPGATILHAAYRELEALVLDRDTLHFKCGVAHRYAELVYYGLWFSPLREALDAFVSATAERVTGEVSLQLYKSTITILSRFSPVAMYDLSLSTYESGDVFDHTAGPGFSYIWSMPLRLASMVRNRGHGIVTE